MYKRLLFGLEIQMTHVIIRVLIIANHQLLIGLHTELNYTREKEKWADFDWSAFFKLSKKQTQKTVRNVSMKKTWII